MNDGYFSSCRACINHRRRERYATELGIKEKWNRDSQNWANQNKEWIKNYSKKYHFDNADHIREKRKQYYLDNISYFKEKGLAWSRANPGKKYISQRKRIALKLNCSEHFNLNEWEELKSLCDFSCLSCNKKEPEIKLEADHIVPLSKGGKNDITNIQPLCKSCNCSKGVKTINYGALSLK